MNPEPTVLEPILSVRLAVGEGTIDKDNLPSLRVLTIEALGQQLGDDEAWYHSTIILGSDQARELIAQLTPRAAAMPTPFEQLKTDTVTDPTTDQKADS